MDNILLIICGIAGLLYIIWKIIKEPKLKAAEGTFLSKWGDMYAIPRIFYGSGCVKPAVDCFWDRHAIPVGWYETDANLRKRIIEKFKINRYGDHK